MSRKDAFKNFLAEDSAESSELGTSARLSGNSAALPSPRPRGPVLRVKTGPIQHLAADLQAGKGEPVLEIDAALIEASFIKDRLEGSFGEHEDLVESIKEHGQQVPALLRPHPKNSARYQVVYGHRRVRACQSLAIPVRAVVRPLTDAQMVVAQGQENSARKALSYIERAFFAVRLSDAGFDREVIMAALTMSKSHLSTLISVGRRIPTLVIEAIGPAPKAGEPRWIALADRLDAVDGRTTQDALAAAASNVEVGSDDRFIAFFEALKPKNDKRKRATEILEINEGRTLATFSFTAKKASLVLDQTVAPNFGRFLFSRMSDLYRDFLESQADPSVDPSPDT
jgi:ParB family transcriptional regulator, chromosome partitioning protein